RDGSLEGLAGLRPRRTGAIQHGARGGDGGGGNGSARADHARQRGVEAQDCVEGVTQKEKAALWPPFRKSGMSLLLAGMTPAVRTREPGAGFAAKALAAIVTPIIGVGITERRGGDRARGSDRGTGDSGCGIGGRTDRSAVVAAVCIAIVARQGRRGDG